MPAQCRGFSPHRRATLTVMDVVQYYADLLHRPDVPEMPMCLTFVGLDDVDEALARFDGFPSVRQASLGDINEWLPPHELRVVVADRHGHGVLLGECCGFHGTRDQTLIRLSRGTIAASVYWDINANSQLSYARAGRLLYSCDFVVDGRPRGEDPNAVVPLLDGLHFGGDAPYAVALAFLERVSGARLTADWFSIEHPASVIVTPETFDAADSPSVLMSGLMDDRWRPTSPRPSA